MAPNTKPRSKDSRNNVSEISAHLRYEHFHILDLILCVFPLLSYLYPCISIPPDACTVSPVQYPPSGDASSTKHVAISTGIPGLFNGHAPTPSESIASAGIPFVAGCNGVHLKLISINTITTSENDLHDPRRHRINPDPVLRLLLRKAACKRDNRALGGRVVEIRGIAHVREDGRAVDNCVAALHVL
jgi:hypothetical protein